MSHLLPFVEATKAKEKYDVCFHFTRSLAMGEMTDKIAYLLYLDVLQHYSNQHSKTTRYPYETKLFGTLGYKLFHSKFLIFISGGNKGKLSFKYQ